MKENRTIVAIGEPSIDVLPKEMLDCFYTTLLTRIAELIQADKAQTLDTTAARDKARMLDTTASHEEAQNELSKV